MSSSRLFDDALSQYLEVDNAGVPSTLPISVSCWFKTDRLNGNAQTLFWMGDKDVGDQNQRLLLRNDVGNTVDAATHSTSFEVASTSTTFSADIWQHACGVWASTSSRAAYLNGGNKGTDTNNLDVAGEDSITIGYSGDSTPSAYMSGNIALVILRDVALSDAEVAEEAAETTLAGILAIQTAGMTAYWLNGTESDDDHDTGTFDLTPQNSPTWDAGDWPLPAADIVLLRRRRM